MKSLELKPFRDNPEDFDSIEAEIVKVLRAELYLPLIQLMKLPKNVLKNSMDDLMEAIRSGQIVFNRGRFTGKFSSVISRELKKLGATRTKDGWSISLGNLPIDVKNAISSSQFRFESTMKKIDERLSKMLPAEIADKFKGEKLFDKVLWKTDKKIASSLKPISVAPQLTPSRRAEIAEEYTNNMRLYIKEWSEKQIVKLRKQVQDHIFAGKRYESMVETIQKSYGVGQRKAKFLARQETNLLMAKFKTARYTDSGITHYKWRSVVGTPAHPVRPRHKQLNEQSNGGRLFRFDDPPVMEDGTKKNPGEDYNCRCVAIPVVKF